MRTTILYLHDSTACWTLWQGQCLVQVFCETITREMAEQEAEVPKKEVARTLCPWLSSRSQKVRLLIDPVVDQTQTIPAFNYGFPEAKSAFGVFRNIVNRIYLTCRSLTSDVIADDLTHYRRDQLNYFPKGFLHWNSPSSASKNNVRLSASPPSWLITESGVPDYVLDWLLSMSGHGIEITDVRPVSTLFSIEDAAHECPVVTVWAETKRWRLLITANGVLHKAEQWSSELQALIAFEELISTMKGQDCTFKVRYIGEITDLEAWQKIVPETEFQPRENAVRTQSRFSALILNSLPSAFCDLPVDALFRSVRTGRLRLRSQSAHLDFGVSIQQLLLKTLWKRRYLRSVISVVVAAIFSGYFVLNASMHALTVVELRDQASNELQTLNDRRKSLSNRAISLHSDPLAAVASIERLNQHGKNTSISKQVFLSELATLLLKRPSIKLHSVSWRSMQAPDLDKEQPQSEASVEALVDIKELVDTPLTAGVSTKTEGLMLISGRVVLEHSQQQASDTLMSFLNALSATQYVIDVVPVTKSLSLTQALNLPSDASLIDEDPSAFVLAVRFSV